MIPLYAKLAAAGAAAWAFVSKDTKPLDQEDYTRDFSVLDYSTSADGQDVPYHDPLYDGDIAGIEPRMDPDANLEAMLEVIRINESNDDYYALVGGGSFVNVSDHPAILDPSWQGWHNSHAAGAYQIQPGTWQDMGGVAKFGAFDESGQTACAIALLGRRGALPDVKAGNFQVAVNKLFSEWESFRTNTFAKVLSQYEEAGGQTA